MKKIVSILLTALLISVSFMSCNKTEKKSEPTTPAQILGEQFNSIVKANKSLSVLEVAENLSSNEIIEFSPVVLPVEPGYLAGFSEDVTGFDDGAVLAPMIGSIPFISYVFKTSGNTEDFIATLKNKADLRWNICTQADEMVIENYKDYVFFAMAPLSFDIE